MPEPAGLSPVLNRLDDIELVLFDIYGTLIVSSSGDVGTISDKALSGTFPDLLTKETGVILPSDINIETLVKEQILISHESSRAKGIKFPEVEIREIWSRVLRRLAGSGYKVPVDDFEFVETAAVLYELSKNEVWPMPGSSQVLDKLHRNGLSLGIISNAQFYTPLMLRSFFPREISFFQQKHKIWSYVLGIAKPDPALFQVFLENTESPAPDKMLYVGNDMLNDITGASLAGMKTALFAGDKRSLRQRKDVEAIADIHPDAIITSLDQVTLILGLDDQV